MTAVEATVAAGAEPPGEREEGMPRSGDILWPRPMT